MRSSTELDSRIFSRLRLKVKGGARRDQHSLSMDTYKSPVMIRNYHLKDGTGNGAKVQSPIEHIGRYAHCSRS